LSASVKPTTTSLCFTQAPLTSTPTSTNNSQVADLTQSQIDSFVDDWEDDNEHNITGELVYGVQRTMCGHSWTSVWRKKNLLTCIDTPRYAL
jgi:hypothetical protein